MSVQRIRALRRVRQRQAGLVGACFLLSALLGPIWMVFSIILLDLEREFGGSRINTTVAFSLFALSHAITTPLIGRALLRFDSRRVMAALTFVLAAGLYLASRATSLSQFSIAFGVVAGAGTQALGSYFIFSLITNRVRWRTGASMSIADAGAGIGIFVGLPALYQFREVTDWRTCLSLLAMMVAVIGMITHALVLPRLRLPHGVNVGVVKVGNRRMLVPGCLVASMFLGTVVLQALQTHQVAALEQLGATATSAVRTVSIMGLMIFLSRLVMGFLVDSWGPVRVMVLALLGAAASFLTILLFVVSTIDLWLLLYPIAVAIGFASQGIIFAARLKQLFEPSRFLSSLALTRLGAGVGLFIGPIFGALAYASFGGYSGMFVALGLLTTVHFFLFFLVCRFQ